MNNTEILKASLGLIKISSRLSSMLKIRRGTPVFNNPKDFLAYTSLPDSFLDTIKRNSASFYDPVSKSVLTNPASKKHELMHAYQHQLPILKNTLAGNLNKIPFVKDRLGHAALELEARVVSRKDKNFLTAFKQMVYNSPYYIKKYEGQKNQVGFKLLKLLGDKVPFLKGNGQL